MYSACFEKEENGSDLTEAEIILESIGLDHERTIFSGEKSGLESSEPIYSDPLDALENADDTKIYHCPEFSEDVVIYEEPPPRSSDKPVPLPTLEENGEKVQTQQQPDDSNQVPRRKRAVSTTHGESFKNYIIKSNRYHVTS